MAPTSWSSRPRRLRRRRPMAQAVRSPWSRAHATRSSSYLAEILRAEGLNEFTNVAPASLTAGALAAYDVVVLGDVASPTHRSPRSPTGSTAGGNLILMRPTRGSLGLAGLTAQTGTVSDGYLAVNAATAPGAGITTDTMQFHGTANRYSLSGATRSPSSTPPPRRDGPARRSPAQRGHQRRSGRGVRLRPGPVDHPDPPGQPGLGGAGTRRPDADPVQRPVLRRHRPDWVNLAKVHIPQADEQQRLLANLITVIARDRMPLPRFWYFPDRQGGGGRHRRRPRQRRHRRPVRHLRRGQPARAARCAVGVRAVHVVRLPGHPLTNAQAAAYNAQGFEVGAAPTERLHELLVPGAGEHVQQRS